MSPVQREFGGVHVTSSKTFILTVHSECHKIYRKFQNGETLKGFKMDRGSYQVFQISRTSLNI